MSLARVRCWSESRIRRPFIEDARSSPRGVFGPRRKFSEFFCDDAKPRDNLHRSTTGLFPLLREELRERSSV
jgi:hypothetical protein